MSGGIALAAITANSALKIGAGFGAAATQRRALKQQLIQQKLAYEKKQINEDDQMQRLNAQQIASSAKSGFSYSGSIANLTSANLDKFALDSQLNKVSQDMEIAQYKVAKEDATRNAWINMFSSAFDAVSDASVIEKL